MTIKDVNFERGVKDFFADEATATKYLSLKRVEDKIALMWRAPVIQRFMKENSEPDFGKSEGDSRRFRDQGNNLFKVGKDVEAIEMFNKAIMKGPVNENLKGKDLSLALANRSAALMRLGHLEAALEDVDLALSSGYPKDLKYKLYDRKIRLAANLGNSDLAFQSRSDFILSLKESSLDEKKKCAMENEIQSLLENLENKSFQPTSKNVPIVATKNNVDNLDKTHSFLPCLSDQIEIEYDPKRGRFAVASTFIPAGTVVLKESAVASVNVDDYSHRYCDFCHHQVSLRLVHCPKCSEVAYCSLNCRDKARSSYHKYECGNTHTFRRILENVKKETGRNRMGSTFDFSRLCFRAICKYPLEWYKKNYNSLFEQFPKFGDDSWDKCVQHSLMNLVTHEDRIKPGRLWSFMISAVCHIKALQLSGYFGHSKGQVTSLSEDETMMGRMLVHLFMLMQFNTHSINESTDMFDRSQKEFNNKTRIVGQGLYPTMCLLNHSCDNNTYKYYDGNTMVLVACKNILPGEEVTEEYFPSVQVLPKDQRRVWLLEHYWFDCQCNACQSDLPALRDISTKYSRFCCPSEKCIGIVEDGDNTVCSGCNNVVELDKIKVEVEKLKTEIESIRVALMDIDNVEENMNNFERIKEVWIRLQQLVKHPYKLLYTTEQLFWKAMRLTHGNIAPRE